MIACTIHFILQNAAAFAKGLPPVVMHPVHASNYRLYVTRELKKVGSKNEDDAFCQMLFCLKPAGDNINWAHCDQCTKWCHYHCVGLKFEVPETFLYPICCS